tara:strand:+ start:144 stop:842 length:699 start_codon:yes stop_codon:yes gene_type:complete
MDKITKHRIQTYSESKKSIFYNFFKKMTLDARNKFFEYFKNSTEYNHDKSILDIGTTPSLDEEQNVILTNTINNKNITCISNQDCKILSQKYPHIKEFVIGNAIKMNFQNDTFDIVHTNATIEHVGSYQNQISLIRETLRVSKKHVFIQTPNRFYPIDFHTTLPLIHWLPKNIHRKILKILGLNFYASEKNLNLLSEKNLRNICKELNLKKFEIIKHKLFFLTSNLILIIEK